MKKLINFSENIVNEVIEGFILINKNKVKRIGNLNVVAKVDAPVNGKVGIVIGGGAGHEPLFLEYIGKGMADVEVHGQIFTAPPPDAIFQGIKAADGGSGVLLLYNNYRGDVLNFGIAQDMAREEGIKVETLLINDEISSAPRDRMEERRGTTADHIIIKIAGASSDAGLNFDTLIKLLKKTIHNARSLGVSLSSCTVPETGLSNFSMEEGKMEFGMGLHGEAGIKIVDLMSADKTTETILDLLIMDLPFKKGDEIFFDVYESILAKLDDELLVKET